MSCRVCTYASHKTNIVDYKINVTNFRFIYKYLCKIYLSEKKKILLVWFYKVLNNIKP